MSKLALTLTLALSLVGLSACSQEARLCRRMKEVCGVERAECREVVDATRRASGDEGVAELARCYEKADSCAEAAGCQAALGIKGAASAVGDFLGALGDELGDEHKKE